MIVATPNVDDSSEVYRARLDNGATMARMDNEPEKMPAAPTPVIARAQINITEVVATAHNSEPSRKMPTKTK